MAKSMRSKRLKRLRAIRREIVEPIYEKKDAAKFAAQEAALAAPKLPVRNSINNTSMDTTSSLQPSSSSNSAMEPLAEPGFIFWGHEL
ncbi:Chemotaxis response regulator protein-glutamate methylesterase [Bienertia sinuspersici]